MNESKMQTVQAEPEHRLACLADTLSARLAEMQDPVVMTPEIMANWSKWREWAAKVVARTEEWSQKYPELEPVELVDMQAILHPTNLQYQGMERNITGSYDYSGTVSACLEKLSTMNPETDVYLVCEYYKHVRMSAKEATQFLKCRYEELLDGEPVPDKDKITNLMDAQDVDDPVNTYAKEKLENMSQFEDDQPLLALYANEPTPYATTAGRLREGYQNFSPELYEFEMESGGLMIVAEHGDVARFEKEQRERFAQEDKNRQVEITKEIINQ